jgi:hypothetical protein
MPHRSTADGWAHPQYLIRRQSYDEIRKTAKTWQLGRGLPAGRKATTPFPRGRPRGPRGQSKSDPTPAWDTPPHRVAVRRADGPACGPVSNWGLRSLGVDTAREGEHARPRMGPNQHPANRSTRKEKLATGCGITGMPTACGIPRLQPWEEVKPLLEGHPHPISVDLSGVRPEVTAGRRYMTPRIRLVSGGVVAVRSPTSLRLILRLTHRWEGEAASGLV